MGCYVCPKRYVLCEIGYFCTGMIAFHGPYIVTSDAFLTSFATNRKKKNTGDPQSTPCHCVPQTRKVEMFFEQREVAFLSPSKICKNLNFSTMHH